MNRERGRGAFALVSALLVLALAGVMMSASARRSGATALAANAELERLRRRWGALTLQRALLPRVERRLAAAEAVSGPVVTARDRLALVGTQFELIFSDEQAKANVAGLTGRRDWTEALSALGQPTPDFGPPTGPQTPLQALFPGQIEKGSVAAGPVPAWQVLTWWGDGRINFRRCRPEALKVAAEGVLTVGQQARLLSLRADAPGLSLGEMLAQLNLSDQQRSAATALLTDRSRCHSLWIVAQAVGSSAGGSLGAPEGRRAPRRRWHRLAVECQQGAGGQPAGGQTVRAFVW